MWLQPIGGWLSSDDLCLHCCRRQQPHEIAVSKLYRLSEHGSGGQRHSFRKGNFSGDNPGCGFKAGTFDGGFLIVPYDPDGKQNGDGSSFLSSELPGLKLSSPLDAGLDRSGLWVVDREYALVDDHVITLYLRNNAGGSDTYPPIDAPPQKPRTLAAAAALLQRLAQSIQAPG